MNALRRIFLAVLACTGCISPWCAASAQTFLQNGTFAGAASAPWQTQDTNPATLVNVVYNAAGESGAPSDFAARISGRDNADEGIKQDILTPLTTGAGSNGRGFVTRFSVKLDAPASVRCWVYLKNAPNDKSPPVLLAEQVVRTANTWVRIEGVKKLSWSGTLLRANVFFEVLQHGRPASPATVPLPDYSIDNITMALDDDCDGLSNAEELQLVPPTDPLIADTDDDHIPDGWENAHATQPTIPDSGNHSDFDEFTNLEEYFAATDPQDGSKYPGKPCDPAADNYARAMLRYLALLPSKRYLTPPGTPAGHFAVGQMVSDALPANSTDASAYPNNIQKLADKVALATGSPRFPAILGLAAEHPSTQPIQIQEAGILAGAWIQAGGIVQVKFRPYNPWTLQNNGISGTNIATLIGDPTNAAYIVFRGWLSQIADEFARLKNPKLGGTADAVILFRPFSEMNGNWFWWGQLSQEDYKALWVYVYNYMTVQRGLHHLLWVYESDSAMHIPLGAGAQSVAGDYYYPGDDVVDIIGHNLYSDTWDVPYDEDAVYRRYPKVMAIPQAGSASSGSPSFGVHRATGSFDNLVYLQKIEERYPRLSFLIVWNSFGNTTSQYVNIADNLNAVEFMTNEAVVTRESLAWKPDEYILWDSSNLPENDPNGDGVVNLLAYALGAADPLQDTHSLRPSMGFSSGTFTIACSFRSDVHYIVEYSKDLHVWDAVAEKVPGGAWATVQPGFSLSYSAGVASISVLIEDENGFFRLLVSRP